MLVCNQATLQVSQSDLDDLLDQLPQPYLLVGDFNAHNEAWDGCSNVVTNPKGKIVEKLISDNDSSSTYIDPEVGNNERTRRWNSERLIGLNLR